MDHATAPRIPPALNDANRAFWTGGANGQLLITWCVSCERYVHPPVESCVSCGGALEPRAVSGRGRVFTFTVNRHQFHPDVPAPYVVAIVELVEQEGLRFTTNIVACDIEHVTIAMDVEATFEPAGDAWAPVFRPVR